MIRQTSESIESGNFDLGRGSHDEPRKHYRALLQQLDWPDNGASGALRTLGITSCTGGAGVSTVAAQLAVAAASSKTDLRILLIDANLASPSLQHTFGVNLQPGLAESLSDTRQLAEAIQPSPVPNLSILAAGSLNGTSASSIQLTRAAKLIARLPLQFDLMVFDLPPTQSSAAIRTAAVLDGVLLILEADRTSCEVARRTTELLSRAGVRMLGVVLNHRSEY